jgi:hypothetical protein
MTLPVEEEKLKDIACKREREAWQGYIFKNFQHTPTNLDKFM